MSAAVANRRGLAGLLSGAPEPFAASYLAGLPPRIVVARESPFNHNQKTRPSAALVTAPRALAVGTSVWPCASDGTELGKHCGALQPAVGWPPNPSLQRT